MAGKESAQTEDRDRGEVFFVEEFQGRISLASADQTEGGVVEVVCAKAQMQLAAADDSLLKINPQPKNLCATNSIRIIDPSFCPALLELPLLPVRQSCCSQSG
jgi:hypothetical protein